MRLDHLLSKERLKFPVLALVVGVGVCRTPVSWTKVPRRVLMGGILMEWFLPVGWWGLVGEYGSGVLPFVGGVGVWKVYWSLSWWGSCVGTLLGFEATGLWSWCPDVGCLGVVGVVSGVSGVPWHGLLLLFVVVGVLWGCCLRTT